MILSKQKLEKIKNLIESEYNALTLRLLGNSVLPSEVLEDLKRKGLNVKNQRSLLSLLYYNNILNDLTSEKGPKTLEEMIKQQIDISPKYVYKISEEHLNENFAQLIRKLKATVQSRMEGILRHSNMEHRNNAIRNPNKFSRNHKLFLEARDNGLKSDLKNFKESVADEFNRLASTEVANAIGMGSIDRVVGMNLDKDSEDVYVYRIPVNDAKLCKHCRKFYLDKDQTPKVYRLSEIMGNGSNYGKKQIDWKPVALATHPHDRESGILELKPGWAVLPEGKIEYIGFSKWPDYIKNKLK